MSIETTHMRVMKKTQKKLKDMSAIEGKDMMLIIDESVNQREKEQYDGDVSRRKENMGLGEE